jgi:hypothetical protein
MAQTGDTPCENPSKSPVAAVYDHRPAVGPYRERQSSPRLPRSTWFHVGVPSFSPGFAAACRVVALAKTEAELPWVSVRQFLSTPNGLNHFC